MENAGYCVYQVIIPVLLHRSGIQTSGNIWRTISIQVKTRGVKVPKKLFNSSTALKAFVTITFMLIIIASGQKKP